MASCPHSLDDAARATLYQVTVGIHDDRSWSYDKTTTVSINPLGPELAHTDVNRLLRVS